LSEEQRKEENERRSERRREAYAQLTEKQRKEENERRSKRRREAYAQLTEEQRKEENERRSKRRREAYAQLTEEQRKEENEKQSERRREVFTQFMEENSRKAVNGGEINSGCESLFYLDELNSLESINLSSNVDLDDSLRKCQLLLNRTLLTCDEVGYEIGAETHQPLVCVVCDCFITGSDSYHWLSPETLKFHSKILSSSYYYSCGINEVLKSQYFVNDERLKDLLLSPRARQRVIDGSFMTCNTCFQSLAELKLKKYLPKFAISNGFAIGHMPINIMKEVTPLVNNLLAPVRAFNYFLCFTGGREKNYWKFYIFCPGHSPKFGCATSLSDDEQ
jgi:hypothetical protein